jgi:CBS domain-containing protein
MDLTGLRSAAETVGERGHRAREVIAERAPEVKEKLAEATERGRDAVAAAAERGWESTADLRLRMAEALARDQLPEPRRSSMIGKVFNRFTVGFASGYVLGARAGRQRYEQIKRVWGRATGMSSEERLGSDTDEFRTGMTTPAIRRPQSIREVMTAAPETVATSSTLAEAARKMREIDAGAMVVVDEKGKVSGIVTDRDIAVRAVAEGKDPTQTKVQEVATTDLAILSPTDTVVEAVKLMREKAVRRLPVVEDGKAVGIVSIGDLAVERDRPSLLADISAAEPSKNQ